MSGQSNPPGGSDAFPQVPGFQTTALASSTSTTRVWDAVQLSLDRPVRLLTPVAGDMASESAFPRVEALARVFSRLASADVVQVIDVSKTADGTPYVVLEKLDGDTLASVLRSGGPMNAARALGILSRLATTLSSLWDRGGIVLRNLKSSYVVLGPGDVPKIAAFHLADMPNAAAALPPDGATLVGTPQYMAPEQTDGVSRIDWRADLYAAGALFYEMLTGRPPFAWAADPMEVLRLQREASEPAPSDARPGVPVGCSQLLSRMMAKNPGDRYASWAEALADVAALAGGALEIRLPEAPFASTVALPAGADRPAAVPAADSAANSAGARITLKPRIPVAMPPAPAPTARVAPSSPATAPTAVSAPVSAAPVPKRTIVIPQRRQGGAAAPSPSLQKTAKAVPVQPSPQSPANPAAAKKGGVPLPLRAAGAVFVLVLLGFVAWKRIDGLESGSGADVSPPVPVVWSGEGDFAPGDDFLSAAGSGGSDDGAGTDDGDFDASPAVAGTGVPAAKPGAGAGQVRRTPASGPADAPGSGRGTAERDSGAPAASGPETAVADSSGPLQAPAADLPPPSFARRSAPAAAAGAPPNPFKNRGRGGSARRTAPRAGGGYPQASGIAPYQSQPGSVSSSLLIAAINSRNDSASSAPSAPSVPPPPAPSLDGPEEEVAAAVAKYLVQWVREQPFADAKSHAQSFLRGASEKRAGLAKSFRSLAAPFRQADTFEDLVGHALSKSPSERDVTLGGVPMRIRPTGYGSPVLMCDLVGKNGQVSKNRKLSLDRMTDAEKLSVVSSLPADKEAGALASRAFLLLRAGTAEQFREFVKRHKLVDLAPLARAVGGEAPAETGGAGDGAAK